MIKNGKSLIKTGSRLCRWAGLATALALALPAAQAESLCEAQGYTVGFFNGVGNTLDDAMSGLHALKALIGTTHGDEPVEYQTFYNTTGSTVDASTGQDIAEVFQQRANEYDSSGELANRFEYFWEALNDNDQPFFTYMVNLFGGAHAAREAISEAGQMELANMLSTMLSDPPTQLDYIDQRSQLDTLAAEGQKLLLVAHSQGNLFVNAAYDYVAPKVGASSVGVVHIAPASVRTTGAHILADIDLVINALRVQGHATVPPVNITLPFSSSDASGHTLTGTYLDPSRAARARIDILTASAMDSLDTPDAIANKGFFTATLTWGGSGDVDLHTFEPGGAHVYYSHKNGSAGTLDVDNTHSYGPEHYYASCDPAKLQAGIYTIGINNYADTSASTPATVQISFADGGQPLTYTTSAGGERGSDGDDTPITMSTVVVQRSADGRWSASAR